VKLVDFEEPIGWFTF